MHQSSHSRCDKAPQKRAASLAVPRVRGRVPISVAAPRPDARKNDAPARASRWRWRLGVVRATANDRLGVRVLHTPLSKQRRPRSERLRIVFRTDAAGWPHRAVTLTGTRRPLQPHGERRKLPACGGGAGWPRTSEQAARGEAGKWALRFLAPSSVSVIRVASRDHRRICAPGICRPTASVLGAAAAGHEQRALSRPAEAGRGQPVPPPHANGADRPERFGIG